MPDTPGTRAQILALFGDVGDNPIAPADDRRFIASVMPERVVSVRQYGAVGDGATNDQTAFDDAIAAVEASGGVILIPPGSYAAKIELLADKTVLVLGYGATLKPPASSIGVRVSGANGSTALQHVVQGLTIDPSNGTVTAIQVDDNDGAVFRDIHVLPGAAVGIRLFNSTTVATWCERNGFDHVLIDAPTVGIEFDPTGTNSFAECWFNDVFINNPTVGIDVESGANCYRTRMRNVVIWLSSTNIGVKMAGNVIGARWDIALEVLSGSPVGFQVLSGAQGTTDFDLHLHFTGSFGTQTSTYDAAVPLDFWQGQGSQRLMLRAGGSNVDPGVAWLRGDGSGNLVVNPSAGAALFLAFDAGTGGIMFGDGAGGVTGKWVPAGALKLKDGITAPGTESGYASIYVDVADGDLKVKFGDGFVRIIGADS